MSNLVTLADARTFLAPFIDNGVCNNATIDARIAECEERLWPKADHRMSLRRIRVLVRNQTFVLPLNVTRICGVCVNGTPVPMASQAYEFMSSGPGDMDMSNQISNVAVDQGEFATQFDIPILRSSDTAWSDGMYLIAFSTAADDCANTLTIRGYGALGDEIRTASGTTSTPGETLAINRWDKGVEGQILNIAALPKSTSQFMSISRVYKSVTKAPVTLYAYVPSTGEMYFLSKMEPESTIPSYRRYRLTGVAAPEAASDGTVTRDCASMLLLVKISWQRATRADDVLYIQSLTALKNMCLALKFENDSQLQNAVDHEATAVRLLNEQKTDQDQGVTIPVIWDVDVDTSLRSCNHGYLT